MYTDPETGALIRRVTHTPTIHHHPFFMINAYDSAMRRLFYVEYTNNHPQIFCEVRKNGEHCRLTDTGDLNEWSVHPSHWGDYVYFTSKSGGYRVNIDACRTEKIVDFQNAVLRSDSMITTGMGTTALSHDDRYWAVKYSDSEYSYLSVTDTESKKTETILKTDEISHMQFSPDNNIIFYAGKLTDRVWCINRDGTDNRRLYVRDSDARQWITHESFIPNSDELAMVNWNKGVIAVNLKNGAVRQITDFNAWHAVCSPDGTMMTADTNFPDIGIILFDPRKINGKKYKLCNSDSSNLGDYWKGPFPYDNGPIKVYAPQHTHPHPSFSPDNRFIVFTSDKSGYSQVYEARIPDNIKELI